MKETRDESTIKQIPPLDLPPEQEAILEAEEQVPVPNPFNRDGLIGTPIEQRVATDAMRDLQASVRQDDQSPDEFLVPSQVTVGEQTFDLGLKVDLARLMPLLANKGATQNSSLKLSITLSEYLPDWVTEHYRGTGTEVDYRSLMDTHINPGLGHYRLHDLTKKIIQLWVNSLKSVKVGDDGKRLPLRATYRKRVLRCLHKALADAVEDGKLAGNPAAGVKVIADGEDEDRVHPFNKQELDLVLADRRNPYWDFFNVLYGTGARRDEGIVWRRKDFGFDEATGTYYLTVARSWDIKLGKFKTTKGKERRQLYLWPATAEIIKEKLKKPGNPEELIWPGRVNGKPIHPSTITHSFQRTLRRRGISGHCVHDLRHSHAVLLLANGHSVPDVAKRLGHKKPSTTLNYYGAWVDPGRQAQLISENPDLVKAQSLTSASTVFEAEKEAVSFKVGHSGLEPETSVLSGLRSNQLS